MDKYHKKPMKEKKEGKPFDHPLQFIIKSDGYHRGIKSKKKEPLFSKEAVSKLII